MLQNPYLEEVKNYIDFDRSDYLYNSFEKRKELTRKYSWSIPSKEAIEEIIKYSPIIECGAGTGYWASLISKMGGDIVAFDLYPTSEGKNYYAHTNQFYQVKLGSHEKIREYPNHTLMLSWCPYDNDMGYDHINNYSGTSLILIGEEKGGCCGNDKMFELIEDRFYLTKKIPIPQWYGIHDILKIYRRK